MLKKSWAICTMEISRLLKKRQSYILMFAMPLLFTFIFGSLMGGGTEEKLQVLVVDEDGSSLSDSLVKGLKQGNGLFDVKMASAKEAMNWLDSKEYPAAIFITKGFQEGLLEKGETLISFQKIPEFTSSATVNGYLADKLAKIKTEVAASLKWSEYSGESWEVMYSGIEKQASSEPLKIREVKVDEKDSSVTKVNNMSERASGFSIMFVMIMMMSVTGTILEARKNGVWYRLLSTPAGKFEIALGYLMSFFLIGWIQFGVLMIATNVLFDVSWGNPLSVFVLVSALLLAIVGLGLFIAGMVKTVEQQASIGNLVVVATCMISGVYWPLEIEPIFMQKIAEFLPQTWAMRGFTEIIISGKGLGAIVDNLAVLMGFAVLFLVLGMRKIRFE
ncbi:ABC transporter permease [Pseudoneobacillus sp. C159]